MLIDSHCHLDAGEFDPDRQDVIARARTAGVMHQVVPATHAAAWPELRDVCASAPGLHAAYGLHPTFLEHHRPEHLEALGTWIEHERPVAVGECGLDHFVEGLDRDTQRRYFEGQLQLAHAHDLPVIVHARHAVEETIALLRRFDGLHGVVHSFGGSPEQAQQLWKIGFMIGLGGPLTYDRARRLHRVAAVIPIEQLLLETDAPDQPDSDHRGQRNEPARLIRVRDVVAQLRGMSPDEVAAQTTRNAKALFSIA
ncbi:DNAase [Luteimonas chenhongjianii]|uniref:DNAase n=1 Tax=Luteimonas chenhongjianii TaxID=2006110 RepID=A0A290XE96_9GAMM|nr:TatD family hydrolase [Luteimonas chenhongjianii]ATD67465.1 DNAase [Luteimonas chenhongjianii]